MDDRQRLFGGPSETDRHAIQRSRFWRPATAATNSQGPPAPRSDSRSSTKRGLLLKLFEAFLDEGQSVLHDGIAGIAGGEAPATAVPLARSEILPSRCPCRFHGRRPRQPSTSASPRKHCFTSGLARSSVVSLVRNASQNLRRLGGKPQALLLAHVLGRLPRRTPNCALRVQNAVQNSDWPGRSEVRPLRISTDSCCCLMASSSLPPSRPSRARRPSVLARKYRFIGAAGSSF